MPIEEIQLYDVPLMGYFRVKEKITVYQATTYPSSFNIHTASRQVIIPGKKKSGKSMKCSTKVIVVDFNEL